MARVARVVRGGRATPETRIDEAIASASARSVRYEIDTRTLDRVGTRVMILLAAAFPVLSGCRADARPEAQAGPAT